MELLLENPLPALIVGGIIAAILGGGWIQTGRQALLYLMILAILLMVGAVLLERFVVTEREEVKATLFEIARLVEQNDIEAAMQYAYSGSPQVAREATAELSNYRFLSVDIKPNLEIKVFPDEDPPRARADFNVVVTFATRDGMVSESRIPRYVEVTMYREPDGQWRVSDYSHDDPRRGWMVDESP
ncbi:MAG: hypothetical protein JJ992_17630 [Planctomycetes bacterium]|nr:hypothetical protein [Planctomycetota bacterium]